MSWLWPFTKPGGDAPNVHGVTQMAVICLPRQLEPLLSALPCHSRSYTHEQQHHSLAAARCLLLRAPGLQQRSCPGPRVTWPTKQQQPRSSAAAQHAAAPVSRSHLAAASSWTQRPRRGPRVLGRPWRKGQRCMRGQGHWRAARLDGFARVCEARLLPGLCLGDQMPAFRGADGGAYASLTGCKRCAPP